MDFCVRCGKKELYQEHLCSSCYRHVYPETVVKGKKRKPPVPVQHHANYFEAVIQLRNIVPAVADFVFEELEKHHVSVSKVKRHANGVDMHVSSRQFAQKLGKSLQETFGGMVKRSARLFTTDHMSGKEVYRVTILFKQFPYAPGESFTYKGEPYHVLSVGEHVVARAPDKHARKFRYPDLERRRVF